MGGRERERERKREKLACTESKTPFWNLAQTTRGPNREFCACGPGVE